MEVRADFGELSKPGTDGNGARGAEPMEGTESPKGRSEGTEGELGEASEAELWIFVSAGARDIALSHPLCIIQGGQVKTLGFQFRDLLR